MRPGDRPSSTAAGAIARPQVRREAARPCHGFNSCVCHWAFALEKGSLRWAGFFLFDMQIGFGGYFDEVVEESEELRGIGARVLEAEARRMLVADIERRHGASFAPMRAVATGGDGARGVTSGATRGDENDAWPSSRMRVTIISVCHIEKKSRNFVLSFG